MLQASASAGCEVTLGEQLEANTVDFSFGLLALHEFTCGNSDWAKLG